MDELTIYQKHYDLILYAFPIINGFPKAQKFVLGQQIQNSLIDIAKTQVFAAAQGVSFLGYRIWATHRLLREGSIRRMRRKMRTFRRRLLHGELVFKEMDASVQSWLGHARHANTYRLRGRLLSGAGVAAVA